MSTVMLFLVGVVIAVGVAYVVYMLYRRKTNTGETLESAGSLSVVRLRERQLRQTGAVAERIALADAMREASLFNAAAEQYELCLEGCTVERPALLATLSLVNIELGELATARDLLGQLDSAFPDFSSPASEQARAALGPTGQLEPADPGVVGLAIAS